MQYIERGTTIMLDNDVGHTIFTPDKRIKLWDGVQRGKALSALWDFLKKYKTTHIGYRHGVVFGFEDDSYYYVYQTDTLYVVRPG